MNQFNTWEYQNLKVFKLSYLTTGISQDQIDIYVALEGKEYWLVYRCTWF